MLKTAEAPGDSIAVKITRHSKKSSENNLKEAKNEIEIPKEKYISLEKIQQIIDELKRNIYNILVKEYQKTLNLLDNASNQLFKLNTKNWIEINDR